MGLRFFDLSEDTRALMVLEIDQDTNANSLYLSNYLNEIGKQRWPALLREAANSGSDDRLALQLNQFRSFKEVTERRKPKGGFTQVTVPVTAAQTLAESQFNM